MKTTAWTELPNVDRECFGCGPENHHGLHMTFQSNGESIRTCLTVPSRFRGWSKLVHGGVIATILDETMSWTAIHLLERFILTKNMSVQFHRPLYVGTPIVASGCIKRNDSDRKALVVAQLFDDKERLCASSEGEFILYTKEQFERLNIIPAEELELMSATFENR